MDYTINYTNYATLKRRGYNASNYEYIFTVHKYPVRASGFEDVDFLKSHSSVSCTKSVTEEEFRFQSSVARSRSKVLQLGCNNKWDFFITLTISPECSVDRYDFNAVIKSLLKFFDNYKQRKSKDFKYLVIPEKHKDGAYHFHGFFANINKSDLKVNKYGYLDFVPYCNKYGYCSMSKIKDGVACANYVCKYISKDMFNNTIPEPRTHLYYCSRGLKYDEVLEVGTAVELPDVTPTDFDNVYDVRDVVAIDNAYCTRYISYSQNSFDGLITPLVDVVNCPVTKVSDDVLCKLKKRAVLKFCDVNNITIDKHVNLLEMYESLKKDIISAPGEYEIVIDKLRELRSIHKFDVTALSDAEASALNDIFALSEVDDVIFESSHFVQTSLCGDDYVIK
jgi:hypothetical protein